MALSDINRSRIEKLNKYIEQLETTVQALQSDVDNIDPTVSDDNIENITPGVPQNVRATPLFRTIQVLWDFDPTISIASYEVYASQTQGFYPNASNLVWKGKTSAYQHQASVGETWYFKVRAVNTHGVAGDFSDEVSATTLSIEGFEIDETWQHDQIEYANQYTDQAKQELLQQIADKLDAQVYYDNIVLKADQATVDEQFDEIANTLIEKADLTYVDGQLAQKQNQFIASPTKPTDTSIKYWVDTSQTPNVLMRFDDTIGDYVKLAPTQASEVGAYTSSEVDSALQLKANQTDFDELTNRVTNAETSITQNAQAIALKANQSDFDTLSGRVTNAEASIQVNANNIALKANQTDFDTLSGRVTDAETNITTNAQEIALRAKQSDFDTLTNRVTTAESAIEENANQIALRVLQTDFDAVEQRVTDAEAQIQLNTNSIALKVNQDIFDSLAGRVTTAESAIEANTNQIQLRVTKEDYDKDINDEENGLIARMSRAESSITTMEGEILLRALQTDVDTRIGDVVNRLDSAESQIDINTIAISQRVTTSTFNALEGRVTTAEGNITSMAGQIALKASQSDLDETNQRLSSAESSITLNTDAIALKVDKDGVISSINASPESIKISTAKLTIDGDVEIVNGLVKIKTAVIDQTHIKSGTIDALLTANLIASKINSGSAYIDFAHINNVVITDAMISNLNASKITAGVLNVDRIPNLNASKITTGTLSGITISGSVFKTTGTKGNITAQNDMVQSYYQYSDSGVTVTKTSKLTAGQFELTYSDPYAGDWSTVFSANNLFMGYQGTSGINIDGQSLIFTNGSKAISISHTNYDSFFISADVEFNNSNLKKINSLHFNDPGSDEGIVWDGGNGWRIVEAPDNMSNGSGNLQFATGTTRRMTLTTAGSLYIGAGFHANMNGGTGDRGYFASPCQYTVVVSDHANSGEGLFVGNDGSPRVASMDIYNRTYSGQATVCITTAGTLGRATSATKYKINIEEVQTDGFAERILDLKPKSWYDKTATEQYADYLDRLANGEDIDINELDIPYLDKQYGLIAEDLVEVGLPEYVIYGSPNENGEREVEGIYYDRLWTLLIPIVKELKAKVESLEAQMVQ